MIEHQPFSFIPASLYKDVVRHDEWRWGVDIISEQVQELRDEYGRFMFLHFKGWLVYIFDGLLKEGPLDKVGDVLMVMMDVYLYFCYIKYAGFILPYK